MQGNVGEQHETYRGLLAADEYGTRRVKQWLKASIEPALRQVGRVVQQYSQAVYTAHKVFRIVQPNNDISEYTVNKRLYDDKTNELMTIENDITVGQFDIRIQCL